VNTDICAVTQCPTYQPPEPPESVTGVCGHFMWFDESFDTFCTKCLEPCCKECLEWNDGYCKDCWGLLHERKKESKCVK